MGPRALADTDTGYAQTITGSKMRGIVPEKLSRPWQALVTRLSVFPTSPWQAPSDLWQEVVGTPPEASQDQPRQRVRAQTGPWRDGALQLLVSPVNVVWVAVPLPNREGLPNLANWNVENAVADFVDVTRPWLTSVNFGVMRLGFGLQALLPAEDKISAYKRLQGLVPSVKIEPETTTDLLYQINRPVLSRTLVGSIRLNRLMKWSAIFFGITQVQTTPTSVRATPLGGSHYASLDIDVNTPADLSDPLEGGSLGAIFDELVELAWRNLEAGEIA